MPASSAEQSLGETRESLGETRGVHTACRANRETARGSALLRGEGAKPATKPTASNMCTGLHYDAVVNKFGVLKAVYCPLYVRTGSSVPCDCVIALARTAAQLEYLVLGGQACGGWRLVRRR